MRMCYLRTKQHVYLLHITVESWRRWAYSRPDDTEHTTNLQELSLRLSYKRVAVRRIETSLSFRSIETGLLFRFLYNSDKLELCLKFIPIQTLDLRVPFDLYERVAFFPRPHVVSQIDRVTPMTLLCEHGLIVTPPMIIRSSSGRSVCILPVLLRYYTPSSKRKTLTGFTVSDNLLIERIVTRNYFMCMSALCTRPHVYKWTYARLMSCCIWYDRYEFVVALLDTGYTPESKHFRSALIHRRTRIINEFVKRQYVNSQTGRALYDTRKIRNLGYSSTYFERILNYNRIN